MANLSIHQIAYLKRLHRHRRLVGWGRILLFVGFLLCWEGSTALGLLDSFIFSSPSKILQCGWDMLREHQLLKHISITLGETLLSFLGVTFGSLLFVILLWYCHLLSEILEPALVVLNSLPKSALAPLLIVWLGARPRTIIIAGMSVAVFGCILNLYTGFQHVDQDKLKLIYTLGGKRYHALWKVVIPSSIPMIISNMKVNIGLCLVGVIIGEFLAAKEGLGYLIIYSSQVFKMDWLLLSICILCLLAMGLYTLIQQVEKWYQKRA